MPTPRRPSSAMGRSSLQRRRSAFAASSTGPASPPKRSPGASPMRVWQSAMSITSPSTPCRAPTGCANSFTRPPRAPIPASCWPAGATSGNGPAWPTSSPPPSPIRRSGPNSISWSTTVPTWLRPSTPPPTRKQRWSRWMALVISPAAPGATAGTRSWRSMARSGSPTPSAPSTPPSPNISDSPTTGMNTR